MNQRIPNTIFVVLRVSLGLIFFYSGLEKIARPYDFFNTVYDFDLAGPGLSGLVAAVLPWFELLVAWALIMGTLSRGALLGCCGMGALFIAVQFSAVWRGLSIKCGCFGSDEEKMVGRATLIRTSLIFLLSAGLAAWSIWSGAKHAGKTVPRPGS